MNTLEDFKKENGTLSYWLALVGSDKRNPAYKTICDIAKFWTAMTTGKGVHELKIQIREKETDKQKKLRKRVNNTTVRYVSEKIKTTYREVDRCDSIKEMINHEDPDALSLIRVREKCFYGEEHMDKFNDDHLLVYSGMDPNAFQLINIKPYDPLIEQPYAYPSIIKSKKLRDWSYVWNELDYVAFQHKDGDVVVEHLWTKDYAYTLRKAEHGPPPDEDAVLVALPSRPVANLMIWEPVEGAGFVLEGQHRSIVMPEAMLGIKNSKQGYYLSRFEHGLGFVPAKQLGWVKSFEHEHEVLESYYLPAKERFIELYQKKSAYDIHLAVHGIAKQISYIPTCNYVEPENHQRCIGGTVAGGECPKCKGTGKMPIHKSEMDVVTIELPLEDGEIQIIDASKLHQYIMIPQHIIEMHEKSADTAARDVALAIFNTNIFKRAELTAATATEVIQNNKSVDNALYAYASHKARTKEFQLKCIAAYMELSEGFEGSIKYPSSFNLETQDELYMRRKLAKEAGTDPMGLDLIDQDILAKQNADNPERIAYIRAIKSLRPFNDATESERIALFTLLDPKHPKRLALLYFDDILYELDGNKKTKGKWFLLEKPKMLAAFDTALETVKTRYQFEEVVTTVPFASVPPIEEEEEDDLL